jgi:hypothetical protein
MLHSFKAPFVAADVCQPAKQFMIDAAVSYFFSVTARYLLTSRASGREGNYRFKFRIWNLTFSDQIFCITLNFLNK